MTAKYPGPIILSISKWLSPIVNYSTKLHINIIPMKWHPTTGILCNRRINKHLKSKNYCCVVWLATLYISEYCTPSKGNGRWCTVMVIKIAFWSFDITMITTKMRAFAIDGLLQPLWRNCLEISRCDYAIRVDHNSLSTLVWLSKSMKNNQRAWYVERGFQSLSTPRWIEVANSIQDSWSHYQTR